MNAGYYFEMLKKAERVLQSCRTTEQGVVAGRYANRVLRRIMKPQSPQEMVALYAATAAFTNLALFELAKEKAEQVAKVEGGA